MTKPDRNQIYDAVIRRIVIECLAKKEEVFAQEHTSDTNEQLLEYLKEQANELGHTPWPKEIVGWKLITDRFGSWLEAVHQAGLGQMRTPNTPTKFKLYLDEAEYQKKMYRVNRKAKKTKSIQRRNEKIQQRLQKNKESSDLAEENMSNK